MNSKHLHIQNAEIRQDGSMLIFFEEDAHTFIPSGELKGILNTYYELWKDDFFTFDEEE